ncbi:MAG: TolB family protein, partial [Candidatus Promineifilaceae bacterium]
SFESRASHSPRWSADGRYLAYYHSEASLIVVLDMQAGRPRLIPANLEVMGGWSPAGYQLAYTELAFGASGPHDPAEGSPPDATAFQSHVVVADIAASATEDLTAGEAASYSRPSWSPDGRLLATARSAAGAGGQLVLLSLNGAAARPLTAEPAFNHSAVAFAPDGRQLAFMRASLSGASAAGVWLLELAGGRPELVAENAFVPAWRP